MTVGTLVKLYDICKKVDGKRVYGLIDAEVRFASDAAAQLNLLCEAAYRETGMVPHIRTVDHMTDAYVGLADYESYRALRFSYYTDGNNYAFSSEQAKPLADFIEQNAHEYGFINLSGEGDDGHFRYVGIPHALVMQDKNLTTLAAYAAFLKENYSDKALSVELGDTIYYIQSFDCTGVTATVACPPLYRSAAEISATGNGTVVLTVKAYGDGRIHALPYVAPENADRSDTVIYLDAGHGAHDPGAISPDGSYYEKDFNLAVTLKLRDYLTAMGYTVRLTREDDSFLAVDKRAPAALQAGSDLFISLHCNSVENIASPTAVGPQLYYNEVLDRNNPLYPHYLNKTIVNTFRSAINQGTASYIESGAAQKIEDNDVCSGSHLAVLREPRLPAILVEMGFITNSGDIALFLNEAWQETMAYSLALAVDTLFANDQLGAQ